MANLKEKALSLLSTTAVDLSTSADTTLYTVPAGKRCVLSHAIIVVDADASSSTISIGADGTETDFVGVTTLSALNVQYACGIITPVPSTTLVLGTAYGAGVEIQAQVAASGGGASTVYLYGFIY